MNKPVLPMSSLSLKLPMADRSIETYRLAASRTFPAKLEGTLNRVAFSAAHVVADPLADNDPWLSAAIDWDRTIAFREHVWDLGLGVAEAMDTAQRGMGLDWPTSLELIQRSVNAAKAKGNALVFSGVGTDHLAVEEHAILRTFAEGSLVVASAGNDRMFGSPASYPASFAHVLTIGATNEGDRPTNFSSISSHMDLAAPGQDIAVAAPLPTPARTTTAMVGPRPWIWVPPTAPSTRMAHPAARTVRLPTRSAILPETTAEAAVTSSVRPARAKATSAVSPMSSMMKSVR